MTIQYAQAATTPHTAQQGATGTRLRGRWLLLARVSWLAMVVPLMALFFAAVPAYYEQLRALPIPNAEDPAALREGLRQLGFSVDGYALYVLGAELALALGFFAIAALIFARRSDEWLGLFVSLTLIGFGVTYTRVVWLTVDANPVLNGPVTVVSSLSFASFFILFYLFPNGRFVPRWTWVAAVVWLATEIAFAFFALSDEASIVMLLGLLSTCIFAQIYRYRRVSGPVERQQTKWVVFGFIAAIIGLLAYGLPDEVFPGLIQSGLAAAVYDLIIGPFMTACFLLVPLTIAIAILRYRLWDIDIIINRTLVYGALTAIVVGLYVLAVNTLGTFFRIGGSFFVSLLATGLIAVIFQPLRERLQRAANRLMFGERDEPYGVISRLGQRLEATLAPEAVLPAVVETVAQALNLPYTAIALRDEEVRVVAAYGEPSGELLRLPLVYQGESVGELLLAPRAPGERFSPADRRLLEDLARQAGTAAHAVQLTTDLQRSRERLVTAREEERRRLRRDLHDGLGPTLAAQTLKVGAARALLARDPAAADALLLELESGIDAALTDIRRLVYNLRPPALDELGLVGAIREGARQYGAGGNYGGLSIRVDAPESMPPLPAAVEVAAYRIVQEALTNVVRHAHARICRVTLSLAVNELEVEIVDDGAGLPAQRKQGVGLSSMRERAAELGGTCLVEWRPEGGTRVLARLPLANGNEE